MYNTQNQQNNNINTNMNYSQQPQYPQQPPVNAGAPAYDYNFPNGAAVPPPPKKSKAPIIVAIVITAIIVLFVGIKIYNSLSDKAFLTNLETVVENYEPGTASGNSYTSSYWDLDFTMDSDWEAMSSSELYSYSENARESGIESMKEEAEKSNVSSEDMDRLLDIFYCDAEFGYEYSYMGSYACISGTVISLGEDVTSADEFIEETKDDLEQEPSISDVETSSETINGKEYQVLTLSYTESGITLREQILVREKDGMILMVFAVYTRPMEDTVTDILYDIM